MLVRSTAFAALLSFTPSLPAAQIPWIDPQWRIEAAESTVEEYRGREALRIRNGTAWLEGIALSDGTIEWRPSGFVQSGWSR